MVTFEDKYDEMVQILNRRRGRWPGEMNNMSFEDVKQHILFHVYKKWHKYDQRKPLDKWFNTIITNQIKNLKRDLYGNLAPPCEPCKQNLGGEHCAETPSKLKCSQCSVYADWELKKKLGHEIRNAISYDHPEYLEAKETVSDDFVLMDDRLNKINDELNKRLDGVQMRVYQYIYVDGLKDKHVKAKINFKNYGISLECIKKKIKSTVKKIIDDLDMT